MKSSHLSTFNEYLEREESKKCKLQTSHPLTSHTKKMSLSGKLCILETAINIKRLPKSLPYLWVVQMLLIPQWKMLSLEICYQPWILDIQFQVYRTALGKELNCVLIELKAAQLKLVFVVILWSKKKRA